MGAAAERLKLVGARALPVMRRSDPLHRALHALQVELGFAPRVPTLPLSRLQARPLISVLVALGPAADGAAMSLTRASVEEQTYPHWDLRLDDPADVSTTCGDFIAVVEPGVALDPSALLAVAATLQHRPDLDLLYTDEEQALPHRRGSAPHYKPDWSPDRLLCGPYLGRLVVVRTAVAQAAGGLRTELGQHSLHDLALRITEHTQRIQHIPEALAYGPSATADGAELERIASDAIGRRGLSATTARGLEPDTVRVRFRVLQPQRVTIVIPTRDQVELLRRCIGSLDRTLGSEHDVELVIVDNGSQLASTLSCLRDLEQRPRTRVLRDDQPFNYSRLNNMAVRRSRGDVLLFLNDDTEAIASGWLEALLEYAQQPGIGIVGPKLLFPGADRRVQSAGIVLGVDGVAASVHRLRPEAKGTWYGPNRVANYSAVTGACLMIRRDVFERIGGFDERLAVAFNDVDLCLRVWRAGYRVVYTPFAVLVHHESASLREARLPLSGAAREVAIMRKKWGTLLRRDPFYNPNLPVAHGEFVSDLGRRFGVAEWVADAEAAAVRRQPLNLMRSVRWILRVHGVRALARETARFGLARFQ